MSYDEARDEAEKARARLIEKYKARAEEVAANITAELRAKGVLSENEEVFFDMRVGDDEAAR